MVTAEQRKTVFGLCKSLGLDDDNRHAIMERITGKESLKNLSEKEAWSVIYELRRLQNGAAPQIGRPATKKHTEVPGGATEGQQRKIYALMYELIDYDMAPSSATLGERLCGIIEKELKLNATPQKPFAWLKYKDANKLIELIKKYIASAKRKAGGKRE
ncbi:MAG: regulatory protein GemA [Oscillospiraceae bacterium]|jgi:hypothetical protein|nr:regulatory protein GemA [Oscillospiraceae bacterium]